MKKVTIQAIEGKTVELCTTALLDGIQAVNPLQVAKLQMIIRGYKANIKSSKKSRKIIEARNKRAFDCQALLIETFNS